MAGNSYSASDIKTMSTLDFMRSNAPMLLGNLNLDANCQCITEFYTNAQDECISPTIKYPVKIIFFKGKDTYQVVVVDHGRGIPCDALKRVFLESYTSGKYAISSGYNTTTSGRNGIGSKVAIAVSTRFMAWSSRPEGLGIIRIEKGKLIDYHTGPSIIESTGIQGTTVFHQPDPSILSLTDQFWTSDDGFKKIIDLFDASSSFKGNVDLTIHLIDHLLPEKWFKQSDIDTWTYLQNLTGKVIYRSSEEPSPMDYINRKFNITKAPEWSLCLSKLVNMADPNQNGGFDICLNRNKGKLNAELIGTVNTNFINRPDSSHIKVLMNVLKEKLLKYLPEDDDELRIFFEQKYIIPVYGYAQVQWRNASYAGQTKDSYYNKEFEAMYYHDLKNRCDNISDDQWELLYELINDDLMADFTRTIGRSLNLGKNMKNISATLNNDCYTPCRLKDPNVTELFITEGDSAGNWIKQARDPAFQAVLKLRGKPLNAFDADAAKIKANAVLQDMFRIIGVSPRDTDLSNMNFHKIGILADADPDGYHIVCLTIGNLYKINPLILEEGRVFIANPPLYEMDHHESSLYMRDQKALNDVRVKIYSNYLDIYMQVYNHKELNSVNKWEIPVVNREPYQLTHDTYRDFVYLTRRVGTVITEVANRLAIEPILLEQLLHCVDDMLLSNLNTKAIRDKLQITDCQYNELANTLLLIDHDVETTVQLNRLVSEVRAYILPILEEVHWENFNVFVSTKCTDIYRMTPMTFYQIYQIFNTIDSRFNMHIHKGLASTPIDILKISCCDPKTRSSSVITSIGDVNELWRMLGSDPTARKQLIRKDLKELQVPDEFIDHI